MPHSKSICVRCSAEFISRKPSPRFCSRRCKDEHQIADIDVAQVALLYANGMTQAEIADELKVNQTTIFNTMRRHGIAARRTGSRDPMKGARHPMWRGDAVSYTSFHHRIYRRLGQPLRCDVCETTDPSLWYDWANLTGHYEDPNDYKRRRRSCHCQYDRVKRIGGWKLTENDVRFIRKAKAAGERSAVLASLFDVDRGTINRVANRTIWTLVTDEEIAS